MESGVNAWTTWRRQLPGAGFWFSLSVFTGIVIASFLLFETSIQHAITGLVQALVQQPAYQLSLAIVVILLLIFDVLLPVPSMLLALLAATHLGFLANAGLAVAYAYIGSFLAGETAFLLIIFASVLLPGLFLFCRSCVIALYPGLRTKK